VFTGLLPILTWTVAAAAAVPAANGAVPVHVDFSAPAGCADANTFWSGIVTRTEKARAARAGDAAMRMSVRLSRAGAKVHGELRITVTDGHLEARRVDGASCAEVVQVLSLTAALAIDPSITLASPGNAVGTGAGSSAGGGGGTRTGGGSATAAGGNATSGGPAGEPAPPPPAPAAAAPPPAPPAPPPPPPRPPVEPPNELVRAAPPPEPPAASWPARGPAVALSFVTAQVLSSTLSVGGAVSGRLASAVHPRAPSVTATFAWTGGDFFHSGDDLSVRWLALSFDGCPGWRLGGFASVEPCARLTAGILTTTDDSIMNPRVVDRWWGAGGAVIHGEVGRADGFWLKVDVGLEFPFVQRTFERMSAFMTLGSTAPVYPTLAVGLAHSL
jgi:hypothetical protein